jgi:hypothetical protein
VVVDHFDVAVLVMVKFDPPTKKPGVPENETPLPAETVVVATD